MASEQGSGTELEEVEMTICGIEMSGSEARLVLLNGGKSVFSHVNIKPKKLKLADDENPDEVKAFHDSIFAFLRENNVTLVAIKKRGKKGDFSGGPVGFKLEGIIQLFEDCPVKLVTAQTISAKQNKDSPDKPDSLLKYQHIAFETAYCVLQ
jgi:hypothetical protein